jgi:ribosome recycling factor
LIRNTSHFDRAIDHLKQELKGIRTGRANPAFVEAVRVQAYNATLPLVQLASITAQDARTLVIQPWDASTLKEIERALLQAKLGMTPVNDGIALRLTIPVLTEERRKEYQKIMNQKLEAARVAVRKLREEHLRKLREQKQSAALSENSFFNEQKELQKIIDQYIESIEKLGKEKEQEIFTV